MPNNVMAQLSTTSDVIIIDNLLTLPPIRHETLTQCWCDVGPPSATLAQHEANTGQCLMFRFHPRNPRHSRQSRDTGEGGGQAEGLFRQLSLLFSSRLIPCCYTHSGSIVNLQLCLLCKHKTLNQCWFNVGPTFTTLRQH